MLLSLSHFHPLLLTLVISLFPSPAPSTLVPTRRAVSLRPIIPLPPRPPFSLPFLAFSLPPPSSPNRPLAWLPPRRLASALAMASKRVASLETRGTAFFPLRKNDPTIVEDSNTSRAWNFVAHRSKRVGKIYRSNLSANEFPSTVFKRVLYVFDGGRFPAKIPVSRLVRFQVSRKLLDAESLTPIATPRPPPSGIFLASSAPRSTLFLPSIPVPLAPVSRSSSHPRPSRPTTCDVTIVGRHLAIRQPRPSVIVPLYNRTLAGFSNPLSLSTSNLGKDSAKDILVLLPAIPLATLA